MTLGAKYYCYGCSAAHAEFARPSNFSLTGTQYQAEKFIKHTAPTSLGGKVSVFLDSSFESYKQHAVNTSVSGAFCIDAGGRTSIEWFADKPVGITYVNGAFSVTADAVRIVKPFNDDELHLYPFHARYLVLAKCADCGKQVVTSTASTP